eukprot:194763-Pyramimonas_sp.AAC.1
MGNRGHAECKLMPPCTEEEEEEEPRRSRERGNRAHSESPTAAGLAPTGGTTPALSCTERH